MDLLGFLPHGRFYGAAINGKDASRLGLWSPGIPKKICEKFLGGWSPFFCFWERGKKRG